MKTISQWSTNYTQIKVKASMQLGLIVNNDWQNTSDVTRLFARGKKKKIRRTIVIRTRKIPTSSGFQSGGGDPLGGHGANARLNNLNVNIWNFMSFVG